jgi:hypothetical protein
MTFTETNRIIREEQSIKMSTMTQKEKNDYISSGAKKIQEKIDKLKLSKANTERKLDKHSLRECK